MGAVAFVVQIGEMDEAMRGLALASRSRRIFTHCGSSHAASATTTQGAASNPVARKARWLILRGFIENPLTATDIARGNWQR